MVHLLVMDLKFPVSQITFNPRNQVSEFLSDLLAVTSETWFLVND